MNVIPSEAFTPVILAIGMLGLGWSGLAKLRRHLAVPTILFSSGLALLVLNVLTTAAHNFSSLQGLQESVPVLLGLPLITYLASLYFLTLRFRISPLHVAILGGIGVALLYFVGGYTLITLACGYGSGGC